MSVQDLRWPNGTMLRPGKVTDDSEICSTMASFFQKSNSISGKIPKRTKQSWNVMKPQEMQWTSLKSHIKLLNMNKNHESKPFYAILLLVPNVGNGEWSKISHWCHPSNPHSVQRTRWERQPGPTPWSVWPSPAMWIQRWTRVPDIWMLDVP